MPTALDGKTSPKSRNSVTRNLDLNGIDILDVHTKKSSNLKDPFVDVELKVNNPIGRMWEAIKRIWKSQTTVIGIKFSIPLLVLPIVLFVGYRLWLGRGVNVPMAKVGVIHAITLNGTSEHVLVLPTSDVFLLHYSNEKDIPTTTDTTMVVFGMYNHLSNTLTVEKIASYNMNENVFGKPGVPTSSSVGTTLFQQITNAVWLPFEAFLKLFQ